MNVKVEPAIRVSFLERCLTISGGVYLHFSLADKYQLKFLCEHSNKKILKKSAQSSLLLQKWVHVHVCIHMNM